MIKLYHQSIISHGPMRVIRTTGFHDESSFSQIKINDFKGILK